MTATIVGGASTIQPAVIGTSMRFARSLTNARAPRRWNTRCAKKPAMK